MSFSEVIGHERARALLARILTSQRLPHAFLFHGPEGVGKGTLARLFAASLICTAPRADGTGCGTCSTCLRAAHGNHPDLLVVTRLPKKESLAGHADDDMDDPDEPAAAKGGELRPFIVVQQIRELSRHAAHAPHEARRRVFLIDPADRMHAESQNALLKTLEEPPGHGVLILVASRPHLLLPTVRSRCFQVGFGAMPPAALAERLIESGIDAKEAKSRASLAEGRPGRAIALDLADLDRRRDEILQSLTALAASPKAMAELSEHVERLLGEGEADLLEGLDLTMALLRDAARLGAGRGDIIHADLAPRIERLARTVPPDRAMELVGMVDRLRGELRLNLNKTLLVEAILAAVAGGQIHSAV